MRPQIRNLIQTSDPADEPVDLVTAKAHLKVTFDDDDLLIAGYLAAAREWCEKHLKRAFVARSYDLKLDAFYPPLPREFIQSQRQERPLNSIWGTIDLPKPPLLEVTAINYLDIDGAPTLLDPSQYLVSAGGRGVGSLAPAYGLSWPLCRVQMGSVVISYRAGYGTPENVPQAIRRGILLILGGLYRYREPVADVELLPIPFGVKSILSSCKWC